MRGFFFGVGVLEMLSKRSFFGVAFLGPVGVFAGSAVDFFGVRRIGQVSFGNPASGFARFAMSLFSVFVAGMLKLAGSFRGAKGVGRAFLGVSRIGEVSFSISFYAGLGGLCWVCLSRERLVLQHPSGLYLCIFPFLLLNAPLRLLLLCRLEVLDCASWVRSLSLCR